MTTATLPFKVADLEFWVSGVPVFYRESQPLIRLETMSRIQSLIVEQLILGGVTKGEAVKMMRKMAGLKATEFAELNKVRPETVSSWERDKTEIPPAAWFMLASLVREKLGYSQSSQQLARILSNPSTTLEKNLVFTDASLNC